jgi:hypothetical protein
MPFDPPNEMGSINDHGMEVEHMEYEGNLRYLITMVFPMEGRK